MLCKEVIDIIERDYPEEYALDWDNVGLLAGRDDREVRRICLALDAVDEAVHAAAEYGADMLITHHPLIFSGIKRITNQNFTGRRILELIRHDISYYAMHTNYDVLRMADLSGSRLNLKGREALEVTCERKADARITEAAGLPPKEGGCREGYAEVWQEGIGRIGKLEVPVTLRQFCGEVKKSFCLESVRVFGDPGRLVERIAVCPGSGKSVIAAALKKHADVLVTGDIGHHEGIDAAAQGMAVIDAGHYGLEHIFVEDMKQYLENKLENVEIRAALVQQPFVNI